MRTVPIFNNDNGQTICIPKDMGFSGIDELEIVRQGDTLILRPVRPDWLSFSEVEKADDNFSFKHPEVVEFHRLLSLTSKN